MDRAWRYDGRIPGSPTLPFYSVCPVMLHMYRSSRMFTTYCRRPHEGGKGAFVMTKILFICHGNICRSPMAEFVMKDLVEKAGLSDRFRIASAATSTEEIGNPVYPPARKELARHGISCMGKTARQVKRSDYSDYDLLVCMDNWNIRNTLRIVGSDPEGKICSLLDFAGRKGEEVADPWYTGDFEETWDDVLAGCKGLLEKYK